MPQSLAWTLQVLLARMTQLVGGKSTYQQAKAYRLIPAPLSVVSTNGNGATVSVGGDHMLVRVDQAPGGDYYGNFPPGMQLIVTNGGHEGIVINFSQPVYGGGAQVGSGSYGPYDARVRNRFRNGFAERSSPPRRA
jgi:hypothetical protein